MLKLREREALKNRGEEEKKEPHHFLLQRIKMNDFHQSSKAIGFFEETKMVKQRRGVV
jgi:hypothetical protein